MEKWAKIEELINKLLEALYAFLGKTGKKLTPKKISSTYSDAKSSVEKKKENIKHKVEDSKKKTIDYALKQKVKSIEIANQSKVVAVQSIQKAKEVDVKKIDWKKIGLGVVALIAPFFGKIKTWLASVKPTTLLAGSLSTVIIGLTGIGVYTSTKSMSEKNDSGAREIASEVDNATAISTRSGYYKKSEKTFTVLNQYMPVYVDDVKKYKSVRIDFTIVASNKYIKEYFFFNLHKMKDRLNSSIEPIIPTFPLEAEGQYILKVKIKKELNQLIKELGIKGTVEEVHVLHNLAG